MTSAVLGPVSEGCRGRLVRHYGNTADTWLDSVPDLLASAADRWQLRISGYHDAGHASALAAAATVAGTPIVLKTWFDPARYRAETSALAAWRDGPAARLLHLADDLCVAALSMVADRPGGDVPPPGDEERVAGALQHLHSLGVGEAKADVPPLGQYLLAEVVPRIRRRDQRFSRVLPEACVLAGRQAVAKLTPGGRREVLLHADLYRENIAFDEAGRPVFLDPLPMIGDPAFDWAFWTVYYDLARDPRCRLRLAAAYSAIPVSELLPWCLTLCFDGLLYYHETADPRMGRMAEVMVSLAAADAGAMS